MLIRMKPMALGVAAACGGLALSAMVATSVYAQQAQPDAGVQRTELVIITGSRIARSANLISPTPVLTLDLEALGNVGAENFADIATQLPQFAPSFGTSRTQSTFSGVETSGLNLANLRNLGENRTLVLINGRRVPGGLSTDTAVDFNTIPTANIERIEIITGGASAIYGADAVAGVINIITKKNFEGVEVYAGYGVSKDGDNENPTGSLMIGGKFGDKGRGLVTLQYDRQGRVKCADRFLCAEDFAWLDPSVGPIRGPAAYSGVGAAGRFFIGSTSYTRRNGSFTDANGNLIPFSVQIDGYNRNARRDIAIPTTRIMAAAEGEYEIFKQIKAFTEINYGQTQIRSEFEGHPFQSQQVGSRFGNLQATIPVSNPFIPAPLRAVLPATATEITWWQRFSPETVGGPRGADSERNTFRAVGGLKGELDTLFGFGSDWRWEVSQVYGRTRVNLGTEGLVGTAQLYYGLRVEPDPTNPGSFRCSDAGARATGCVPINPFAPYTPAMLKYLTFAANTIGASALNDTVAHLSGAPFELPAGPLRVAVGAEYRTFSGYLDYDNLINQGLATGNQIGDTDFVKTKTSEGFAEILVPIVANKPFANALNFEGAFRTSSVQGGESYDTWKFGGDWEPVTGLRFRAMKARAVRTPVPGDLSGIGDTFGVINDPCTAARRNNNPTRAANCAADGVPANYAPPLVVEQAVAGKTGGNPNLTPEIGTTLTYGFVWQPTFAKGLALTVDRFEIDVKDIIATVNRQTATNLCYDTPGRLFCSALTRGTNPLIPGATYVLTSVNEQLQNSAALKVAGVDVQVRYGFRAGGYGDVDLSLVSTIYDKATLTPLAGQDAVNLLGQAGGATGDLNQGFVKFTANGNIGWKRGPFSANWNMRHIGRADMAPGTTEDGFPKIGSATYHNVRVGYHFGKGSEVFFGVTNLFDRLPPFFASGTSGTQALDTIPGYYDVFGRSYFAGLRMRF